MKQSTNPDVLIENVFFNEVSKILLTEKIIRVEFFVPFLNYEFTMKPDIENMIQQHSLRRETPSLFCPSNCSRLFATKTCGFNVNWMSHQFDFKNSLAQQDHALIRNETAMFLTPPKPPNSTRYHRRASIGYAALAAVGLFGGRLTVGGSDSCGLRGIFGNCQDQPKANAENVRRPAGFQNSLTDYVTELMTNTDEKF